MEEREKNKEEDVIYLFIPFSVTAQTSTKGNEKRIEKREKEKRRRKQRR